MATHVNISLHWGLVFILIILGTPAVYAQNLPSVSAGKIIRIENFQSKYVDARHIDVWLPDDYSTDKKYAVVYMHDGQMLFDSTITWNKQEWGVDETFSTMLKEQKIRDCIVVGIWNNGKYRASEFIPEKFLPSMEPDFRNQFIREVLENKPQSDRYLRFMVRELKPYIDTHFSTFPSRENTFIMGSSRGGLISMYAICEYPDVFGGAAGLSCAYIGIDKPNTEITLAGFNYFNKKIPSGTDHKIYNDCGTIEMDSLYGVYQQYMDVLWLTKGYTARNYQSFIFEKTGHNERDWSRRLYIPVAFLLKE
ncbi:MAG: alpha/beta hydrolase [Lewinellaceae bacterium]|nr:alpha/beta hydrolase [Lewinellaceae bacterium]